MRCAVGVLLAFVLLTARPSAAAEVTGVFEVMSLGADRRVELWLVGDELVAHRVLHLEFEGEQYALEHLFRGTLEGDVVEGYLYVKEDGMQEFDKLRPFIGRVESTERITLDGLPLERRPEQLHKKPPQLEKQKKRRQERGSRSSRRLVRSGKEVA